MRINKYVALATGLSRRKADEAIEQGKVTVNGQQPSAGHDVQPGDTVSYDSKQITAPDQTQTVMLHKPVGYVCSRDGQGSKTVYELLPTELHHLKPVGRLDKDSSGLVLLTNDGELANQLTHPRFAKQKIYQVVLDKSLADQDKQAIEQGIRLDDGFSKLGLSGADKSWTVAMNEGRNRQIRRTFDKVGYTVVKLHRTQLGNYKLDDLSKGQYTQILK